MEVVNNLQSEPGSAEKAKGSGGARIHRSTMRIVGRAKI
jgi:hypothetical protein